MHTRNLMKFTRKNDKPIKMSGFLIGQQKQPIKPYSDLIDITNQFPLWMSVKDMMEKGSKEVEKFLVNPSIPPTVSKTSKKDPLNEEGVPSTDFSAYIYNSPDVISLGYNMKLQKDSLWLKTGTDIDMFLTQCDYDLFKWEIGILEDVETVEGTNYKLEICHQISLIQENCMIDRPV
jgi:hypothetical protein